MPRHEEQATLAYSADELFTVVADVKDYPSFRRPVVQRRAYPLRGSARDRCRTYHRVWSIPGELHQPSHPGPSAAGFGARH
jgi:hypothetical protein